VNSHRRHFVLLGVFFLFCAVLFNQLSACAQEARVPGKSIGKISTMGNLIVLELNSGALGKANLFDLAHRSLRFTPSNAGYRVENLPLQWDPDFGSRISASQVTLHNFAFPFSGKSWDSFSVGSNGSIRFGASPDNGRMEPVSGVLGEGGVAIGRFDQLAEAADTLVNTVPAICAFMKPRLFGDRYVKELADRVIITWDVTEPYGNIQDFTWYKTVNRFQAVLSKDGSIQMSYDQLAAKDGIVGVYPIVSSDQEKAVAVLSKPENPALPANLDVRNVKLSVVGGLFLKVTLETRGPVLPAGDPGLSGIAYRVYFAAKKPLPGRVGTDDADAAWTVAGFAPHGDSHRPSRYFAFGPGLSREVKVNGNTISMQGILPPALRNLTQLAVYADVIAPGSHNAVAQVPPQIVTIVGINSPEKHLSSLTPKDGPFPIVYEAFHYLAPPDDRDLACTVIKALGDKFDFLAYYSDFRIDNQEAGTPSNGPLGTAVGGPVTGIGADQRGLASYCSDGRFQWQFIQPVYVGSNQMQERPPKDAPVRSDRDITFYEKQLSERSQDGEIPPYMYAMSQIAHELGHRWGAFVSAKIGDKTIPLGPTHWDRGLQANVAYPYQRPVEASIMGGGVWQDNFDGTFTQLDDNYYVPASGWSHLDLYLMGLISPEEVPDFFLLRNLVPAGKDANGHPIFKADRTKVTIQDVIAAEGLRKPGVDKSQRNFNTGMVMVVEHGAKPSPELIQRTNDIRELWIDYFATTTGHRASMTATPR
jgi:hypothetical protein